MNKVQLLKTYTFENVRIQEDDEYGKYINATVTTIIKDHDDIDVAPGDEKLPEPPLSGI